MPWCEPCSRFLSVAGLDEAGRCPGCGGVVGPPDLTARAPWHFKLLVTAALAYLGWRAVQGVTWLAHRL